MTGFDQMDTGAAVSVDPLAVLGQLADMSAQEGYYGLQDANLVLLEAVREMQVSRFDLASLLTDWTNDVSQYLTEPALAVPAIMGLLRRPDLAVPMADDEFAQLEAQLYEEAPPLDGAVGGNLAVPPDHGLQTDATDALDWPAQVALLDSLADQAAAKGWFGLQDANLVLSEALGAISPEHGMTGLGGLMARWGELNAQYLCQPNATTPAIIQFLRNPALALPLDDDEFAMLAEQLSGVGELAHQSPSTPAPVFDREAQLARLGEWADQAAAEGLYGLQDANLLLAEALAGLAPENINDTLLAMLESWRELNGRYLSQPGDAAPLIVNFLRQPLLQLALGDDEWAELEAQLGVAGVSEPIVQELPAIDGPEDCPSLVSTGLPVADYAGGLPLLTQELVALLLLETSMVSDHIQAIVIGDSASVQSGLQQASEEMECFANAAKTAGFKGLSQICKHINLNLQYFYGHVQAFDSDALELVQAWLSQVQEYLPAFNDSSASQLIVSGLTDDQWPVPLTFEQLSDILMQIHLESSSVVDESEAEHKQTVRLVKASDEDVSLALPDDVNQELLDTLLEELPVYTQQFSEALQGMQAGSRAALDVAQRVAHTLKGSANTVGVRGIAELTHNLEDILIACAEEQKLPGQALSNALVNAADCLEAMSEALMGLNPPPNDAKAVLQDILDWANRIDREGISGSEAANINTEEAVDPAPMRADTPEPAETAQAQTAMMRVPVGQIENLFRLSGENIILNGQAFETMRRMKQQLQAMQAQFANLQQLSAELEQLVDLKDLSGRALVADAVDFDALEMDQYNELHTASRRLIEAAVDAREMNQDVQKELDQMNEVLDYQQQLMIDTQEAIMKTRLIPISTITPRLQRALRQTCRLTGKQSRLSLSGEHLLIDGDMLNSMVDPLMHLLRNAIDHGIEHEADRLQNGKPAIGQIAISFEREGNTILVTCKDDGRGLDFAAIREAAEKRGVLASGQTVSEDDLKRLILRPNFSTRTQSTQTSGRGVGMDAVYFQVLSLGGTLNLNSQAGQGLTVELRMPLPLSRSHALLAKAGNYRVAIANKGISQVFYSGSGEFVMVDGQPTLQLEDVSYPVVSLNQLLHVPRNPRQMQTHGAVLLVQNENTITAVLLDALFDSLDIVVKGFGHYLKKIPGYMGAAIMGDGSVAPVLDVPELLRTSVAAWNLEAIEQAEHEESAPLLPTVLVVDDSLSQRRAMGQLLADAGFNVITAGDGIEAVNLLKQTKPDAVLTDLEMPRMNGIELTAHIRSQPKIKGLPVIMITSRTTQKHRKMAEEAGINFYLAKPVREDDLLAKLHQLMEDTATAA